jgi:hypothetical protein
VKIHVYSYIRKQSVAGRNVTCHATQGCTAASILTSFLEHTRAQILEKGKFLHTFPIEIIHLIEAIWFYLLTRTRHIIFRMGTDRFVRALSLVDRVYTGIGDRHTNIKVETVNSGRSYESLVYVPRQD